MPGKHLLRQIIGFLQSSQWAGENPESCLDILWNNLQLDSIQSESELKETLKKLLEASGE